jgi:hypothetical protein
MQHSTADRSSSLRYLPVKQIGEVKLAVNLCKFFSDVDVNGDGSMEWDEFTSFIIDKVVASITLSMLFRLILLTPKTRHPDNILGLESPL